jgi:membrane-bound acyltransferase YfiQ involved in biofilm formation
MVRRLLLLNGLAVLGVILNHAVGWGYVAMFWWTDRYQPVTTPNFDQMGSLSYLALRFIEQSIMFSIPAFLFVSGFFVAVATGRHRQNVSHKLLRSRIIHLAIPFLLWSVVYLATAYLFGEVYSPWEYATLLLTGGATDAFYFVPLLIQLYLLSPLLVPLARKRWKALLLVTLFIQVAVQLMRYPVILGWDLPLAERVVQLTPYWFFPAHLFWFTFGIVAGFHLTQFKAWLERWRWGFLLLAVVMVPVAMAEWETLLRLSGRAWMSQTLVFSDSIYAMSFLLAFLGFANVKLPLAKPLSDLGVRSYGVYLVHSLVLIWAAKAIYHLAPGILAHQILFQPLLIVLGLGIPLLLMTLVQRTQARRVYPYAFG